MKLLYLDLETTGLSYLEHGIIEIGGIIEIDGEVKEEFLINCRPFPSQKVSKKALEVNKRNIEDLLKYQSPEEAYVEFIKKLNKYVNKFDPRDKFIIIGYNIYFDTCFLREFFKLNNDNYYASYFWFPAIDVAVLLCEQLKEHRSQIDYFSLEFISQYFDIEFNAHNALEDARTTKDIYKKITSEE